MIKVLAVACAGAFRVGIGTFKNYGKEDFEFRVKKAVPTAILGFGVGAVIGAQDLPLDGNLEIMVEAAGALGVTVFLEEAFKGFWRTFNVGESRAWLAIKAVFSGG